MSTPQRSNNYGKDVKKQEVVEKLLRNLPVVTKAMTRAGQRYVEHQIDDQEMMRIWYQELEREKQESEDY